MPSNLVVVGLVVGLASVCGCSSGGKPPLTTGAAGANGTAGVTGAGGDPSGVSGATGDASTTGDAGTTGAAGTAGTAGTTSTAGVKRHRGARRASRAPPAPAGTAGAAGATGSGDITKVAPTTGCGVDPAGFTPEMLIRQTVQTSGTKAPSCADKKCGPWSFQREYFVQLPTGYDRTKAYPLLFEAPGCGGTGRGLYALPDLASTVIRVGLSPSSEATQLLPTTTAATNQACFDDKDGDDSVEWPFYEAVWDKLASTICFDRNRVFAGGNSNGAWLANELGCKYAGDATHPIRGVVANTGGLPSEPMYKPTCTMKPMAGFWSHGVGDSVNPFSGTIYAMNRVLPFDGCAPAGVQYANAAFMPFPITTLIPISGTDSTSCQRYTGCDPTTPLVVCPLNLNDHSGHDAVVTPGWATFIKLFSSPPLLTP